MSVTVNARIRHTDHHLATEHASDSATSPIATHTHPHTASAGRRHFFATEAVASGLPVHIAAKILGHDSIATTQTYIAVYDQDVIDHHRAFIARRRKLRPSEQYREPTDSEWDEFLGHFANARSNSAPADAPTAPAASTNSPA
jgi:hypothetical protein